MIEEWSGLLHSCYELSACGGWDVRLRCIDGRQLRWWIKRKQIRGGQIEDGSFPVVSYFFYVTIVSREC